jgi:transcriptional regulator with XRE-family HTH domain
MAALERVLERAKRRSRTTLMDLGRQIHDSRLTLGLSQAEVGRFVGVSASTVSRIERGFLRTVSLDLLCRVMAVVGMELNARGYPGGSPVRDRAHLALLERLRSTLPSDASWRTEVPLPNPGDHRAWDAVYKCDASRIGIEAETRPTDVQELQRRLALKERDGGVDRVVLVLSDTRHNRGLLRDHGDGLRATFPVPGGEALIALREGRDPGGNAIILI